MKLYYIANARMPSEKAHGIQLAKMCEAFLLSGADLELVLPARGQGGSLKDFYGLKVEVPVRRLFVLNVGFFISSISFMFSYFFYLLGKENATFYTIDLDNFSFVPLRLLQKKYFLEIHSAKNKNILWRFFLKKVSGIIAIGSGIKESLSETYMIDRDRIIVHPNGIDLEMFTDKVPKERARVKLNLPMDRKLALYVGRETWWKGMGILSETGKFLPADTIKIVNDRPYQEIPLWLSAADLLLVLGTKKNDYSYRYTSPMKIFEYMASRRPILASDTPANREILSENEAYFYEPDNAKDLADKIKFILTNPPDLKLKVDNARKKVEEYMWAKRARSILEFMKNGK